MNRYVWIAALLLGTVTTPADGQTPEHPEIRALHDAFFAAWNRADLPALAASLTADTVYHPMNGATVSGRDALMEVYRQFLADYRVTMDVNAEVLEASGRQGVMMGLYRATMVPVSGGEPIIRGGRYYMALRQEPDGQWRIARELTQPTGDDLDAVLEPAADLP